MRTNVRLQSIVLGLTAAGCQADGSPADASGSSGTSAAGTSADDEGEPGTMRPDAGASDESSGGASTDATAGTATQDGGSETGAVVTGSSGCGMAHEAGFVCFDEDVDGLMRRWCAAVPEFYDPDVVRTVVLGLHGCGGSPEGASSATAPQAMAGSEDLLFIYPAARDSCWDYNADFDVDFVRQVLTRVEAEFCIDPGRTFADGMSSGAMMASRLLCDNVVDGAAAIALNYSCPAPHPVWLYGGTADEYYAQYIIPGRDGWIAANGCASTTTPLPSGPCVEYDGCTHRTIWCTDDRGHVWPSEDWTMQIVDFFRSIPHD